jgi:hypothetical protein
MHFTKLVGKSTVPYFIMQILEVFWMVFNTTFNNILVILWRSVLLMK